MRNKLLLTAAIGLVIGLPAFAQTATSPTPASPTPTHPATASPSTGTPAPLSAGPATSMPRPTIPAAAVHNAAVAPGAAAPATRRVAAETPGKEESRREPREFSTQASNILPADTQSVIAPALPTPAAADDISPERLLRDARNALEHRQTGLAQEALERAETRILNWTMPEGATNAPIHSRVVKVLAHARHALGRNDITGAQAAVAQALNLVDKSAKAS